MAMPNEDFYEDLVTDEPDRGEEVIEDDLPNVAGSATQNESSSPNDSDLDTILKRLFPRSSDKEIQDVSQFIMLGRIFPDNFQEKILLILAPLVKSHRRDPDFNPALVYHVIEGLCQIGLDGKGRVEAVIVSGNTKEVAEAENKPSGF